MKNQSFEPTLKKNTALKKNTNSPEVKSCRIKLSQSVTSVLLLTQIPSSFISHFETCQTKSLSLNQTNPHFDEVVHNVFL